MEPRGAVSKGGERLSEDMLNIADLAPKAASCPLVVVQRNVGEYAGSQFEHAAMATEDHLQHLLGFALDDRVHGTELIGQARVVNDRQNLGDDFLDAFSGTQGGLRKSWRA